MQLHESTASRQLMDESSAAAAAIWAQQGDLHACAPPSCWTSCDDAIHRSPLGQIRECSLQEHHQ
jgi:hypothetical protein